MTSRALQYQQELKEHFFQKIFDEWDTKWERYPSISKDDFEKLPSLNAFVEDLCDDIDAALKNKFPLVSDRKKVMISKENLRRILVNGNDIRLQSRTLNCLAYYLGFEDYEDFKEKISSRLKQEPIVINYVQVYQSLLPKRQVDYQIPIETNYILEGKQPFWKNKVFKGLSLIALMTLTISVGIKAFYFWYNHRPFTTKQLAKVKFNFVEQYDKEGVSYIKLFYDVSALNCDTVTIDYGTDQTYLIDTESKAATYQEKFHLLRNTVSHTYFKPDIWNIKLIVRGQTIRTLTKIVYTGEKWMSWADSYQDGKAWVSKKKHPKEIYLNGKLWLSKNLIEKETVKPNYYTRHTSIQDFDIDGDDAFIEVKLKNDYFEGGQSCFDTGIRMVDENQNEAMVNFIENCIEYGYIHIANTKAEGTKQKMYFMDIDLQKWKVIGIQLINKDAAIFVDGHEIYRIKYQGEFSKIKELQINFKGSGSIDWVKLSNTKTGKIVYFDDFEN